MLGFFPTVHQIATESQLNARSFKGMNFSGSSVRTSKYNAYTQICHPQQSRPCSTEGLGGPNHRGGRFEWAKTRAQRFHDSQAISADRMLVCNHSITQLHELRRVSAGGEFTQNWTSRSNVSPQSSLSPPGEQRRRRPFLVAFGS